MAFYKSCGISDAAVSQWRKGKTTPAMTTIKRIADWLDVSVAYLLGEEQQKPTGQMADGLDSTNYDKLTPENRGVIDDLIDRLLKSQSAE